MNVRVREDGDLTVRVARGVVDMDVRVAVSFDLADISSKKRTFQHWLGPRVLNFTEHQCVLCPPIEIAFHRGGLRKKWTFQL